MLKRQWVFRPVDPTEQMALATMLAVSPTTASVLMNRGVSTHEQAMGWLAPERTCARDPFLLPDMDRAVERLHAAVRSGEPICFYGDYDVDGISATSVYLTFFGSLGASVSWYIPHRLTEGYGLNVGAVRALQQRGVRLLVTSDCGTTSRREVEEARAGGLDVIVTDHHQCETGVAPAFAVINPFRPESRYPFTGLCSAGLAYKVVQAYRDRYAPELPPVDHLLDLVALATIADLVPLRDENRYFVQQGLALITRGARCGIRALKLAAGVDGPCRAGTVAFRLAPRINAAGRLAHAESAVRLLTTESDREAAHAAATLEQMNRERQRMEEEITKSAVQAVGDGDVPPALVLGSRTWHVGVVGIVAARLVERWHRPAIVVAIGEQGIGKGSVRSVPGFDVYRALVECREVLDAFGGHPSAAGLTVQESRLPDLAQRFSAVAAEWSGGTPRIPQLHIDADVSLRDVAPKLVHELDRLHPFGMDNPEPTLSASRLTVLDARIVGDGHLKLTVRQEGSVPFDSIGFRMGELAEHGVSRGAPVDLAFVPELNRWNGLDRVQLRIRDVRASLPA